MAEPIFLKDGPSIYRHLGNYFRPYYILIGERRIIIAEMHVTPKNKSNFFNKKIFFQKGTLL